MWQHINHAFRIAARLIERFSPQDWLMLLVLVTICGGLCLRGFGSRAEH